MIQYIKYKVIFNNVELNVWVTCVKDQIGSCDSYDAEDEPDYESNIDIYEVLYKGVNIIPLLNGNDLAKIKSLITERWRIT